MEKKKSTRRKKTTTRKDVTGLTVNDVLNADKIAGILEKVNGKRFEIKSIIISLVNEKGEIEIYTEGGDVELLGLSEIIRARVGECLE